jgi:hypothetical protein
MSLLTKVDSNLTSLRYAKETSAIGVLPAAASQFWIPFEPNSYKEFGTKIKTVARQPINAGRQLKKGVLVDIDSSAGFNTDLTQGNLQDILQGFFFASYILKTQEVATSVSITTNNHFIEATNSALVVGDLVFTSGYTNLANNGLHLVNSVSTVNVVVNETLVAETPPTTNSIVNVGFQFTAGDAKINVSGSFPELTTTTKDLTTLGLTVGEFIFIGGDGATAFFDAGNNGFARIYSISAHAIQFDKTAGTMIADDGTSTGSGGTALTIRIFFGRVLFNQQPPNIVRTTYTLEQILGYNNSSSVGNQQAQYIVGAVADEFTFNIKTANKLTCDLSFVGLYGQTIDENVSGANTLLSKAAVLAGSAANAPAIPESSAFNDSSNQVRSKLSIFAEGSPNPTPFFAYAQDVGLTVKNNLLPDKAVGVLGAFEVTTGFFVVSGKITAYFADTESINAVQTNANITYDTQFVNNNAGFCIDVPVITLSGGLPKVEINKPITIDFDLQAASGSFNNVNQNYTMLLVFYDYLPTLAAA